MKGTHKNPCDLQRLVRGSVEISGNINEGSEGFFFFLNIYITKAIELH